MEEFQKQTVIVADNDADFLEWAAKHLAAESVEIFTTSSPDEAFTLYGKHDADLLIAEFHLRPVDGVELLKKVRLSKPNAMVILNGTVNSTNALIESMRIGAFDVLPRERVHFELRSVAERALRSAEQMRRAEQEKEDSGSILPPQSPDDLIIGRSAAMQDVYKLIGRVARADAPVLITGESGVGKEVVSNAIHKFSRRAKSEYVAINCAAIPSNLLESELFGHEKGAFTGAVSQRIGRFEQCDGGTLFLDEIGEMPLEVQSKLLRVLQSGEFSRVGGNQNLRSDVRILAATNKRLEEETENGTFREDLFYRLNVVRIHIPPLRRRVEDIRLLAEFFLQRQSESGKHRSMQFSKDSIAALEKYRWPGNVRELENLVERACVLASGNVLMPSDLPFDDDPKRQEGTDKLDGAARRFLNHSSEEGESAFATAAAAIARVAVDDAGGNVIKAASLIGCSPDELASYLSDEDILSDDSEPPKKAAAKKAAPAKKKRPAKKS